MQDNDVKFEITGDNVNQIQRADSELNLELGEKYTFSCKAHDLYPKPRIQFILDDELAPSSQEEAFHEKDEFFTYEVNSTLTFTASHQQNYKELKCEVNSNVPHTAPIVKSFKIQVTGAEFIDHNCHEKKIVNVGDENIEITCDFYANPKPKIAWKDATKEEITKEGEYTMDGENNPVVAIDENIAENKGDFQVT